jgi:hypothetical protein
MDSGGYGKPMRDETMAKMNRISELRDRAVHAAMHHGSFETSGEARLLVLNDGGLMITYRTPFNPLPKPTVNMKFEAALRGRRSLREPYGIEIWGKMGKVFSVGWRGDAPLVVDCYERGSWESALATISLHDLSSGPCRKCALAHASRTGSPTSEQQRHWRNLKRA